MRTLMLSLAAAACLGLVSPATAETTAMSGVQSGLLTADMLDKAQYASSQKKKSTKKKSMTKRSSWGG